MNDGVSRRVDGSTLSDGDLARRVAAGSAEAAAAEAELCGRFVRRVRLYGLRHLRNRDAAEDLAQKAMLLMLEKLRGGAVREPDRIGSFVLGVARMLAHEQRRAAPPLPLPADDARTPVDTAGPADPLASAHLARCLEALPERERTVVVLTYYGEASAREVSGALALAEGHVRVIRHRAIGRLRNCLDGREKEPS